MFEHMERSRSKSADLRAGSRILRHLSQKAPYKEGDRIPLCIRVYDHDEMVNLVDRCSGVLADLRPIYR